MNEEEKSTKEYLKPIFARFVCFLKVDWILIKTSSIFVKILFLAGIACLFVNRFTGLNSRLIGIACLFASFALFIIHLDMSSFFRHMMLNRRYFYQIFERIMFFFPFVAVIYLIIKLI
jgi:hypothetical protein